MNRPEFTREQEDWICEQLGHWYLKWKVKMTPNRSQHSLGIATEQLKGVLCGVGENTFLEDLLCQVEKEIRND